jgi:membrane protein DedA with SNARE-associated domain
MADFRNFVHQSGDWFYLLTLALTFLEGETFVLFAAAACVGGGLDPYKLGCCAWLGSCLGDQCWFFLGRWCGPVLLRRWPATQGKIARVQGLFDRWGAVFILSFRFMYGIRNVSAIALGLSNVCPRRFVILNAIAAAVWALVFVGVGVAFGKTLGAVLGRWADSVEIAIACAFLIGVGTTAIVGWYRARQRRAARLLLAALR